MSIVIKTITIISLVHFIVRDSTALGSHYLGWIEQSSILTISMTSNHATYSVTKRYKPFAPTPQEVSSAVASYCTVSGLHFDRDAGYDNLNSFLNVS